MDDKAAWEACILRIMGNSFFLLILWTIFQNLSILMCQPSENKFQILISKATLENIILI